jgi:hypothetical protein
MKHRLPKSQSKKLTDVAILASFTIRKAKFAVLEISSQLDEIPNKLKHFAAFQS